MGNVRRRQLMSSVTSVDAKIILYLPLVKTKEEITTIGHTTTENSIIYYPDGALLDTVNDYVKVTNSSNLNFNNGSNDLSFSFSCDFTRLDTGTPSIFSKVEGTNYEYKLIYFGGKFILYLYGATNGSIYRRFSTTAITLTTGVTYNLIVTCTGSVANVYLNNIEQSMEASSDTGVYVRMQSTTAGLYIGYGGLNNGFTFIGSISNVKFWSDILSSTQRLALQHISVLESSTTKLYVPYYGNLSDKSNNNKSLISGGSALDYLTKPRWLKSGTNVYQQITSNISDLSFYTSRVDNQFSFSFKYNFSSNSNVSWFNKSNGTNIEYSIKYDTVLGIVIILRDNVVGAEYKYTKLFTPILNTNYAFAFTHTGGAIALGNLKFLINGQLQTATTEAFPNYISMSPASGGTQQVNITRNTDIYYGLLYNWFVISDARNIAPLGWRVPSEADFNTLITYANTNYGYSINGVKAISSNDGKWDSSATVGEIGNNQSINNSLGFNAHGGGFCEPGGGFSYINGMSRFGTTNGPGWWRFAWLDSNRFFIDNSQPTRGLSIRLIKEVNTPTVGGITYDVDGNSYTEVIIGTQIWMVQNLATTKYRNGDNILYTPTISDWANNTNSVGCCCAYGNDITKSKGSEYLNGSIKNLKVESIAIPQSTVVKYANDAESYRVLDMQFNNAQEDYLGHTVTDTAMSYVNNRAVFNGSTSKITIANSSYLSFTNGIKDLPLSIDIRFTPTTITGNQFQLVGKANYAGLPQTGDEYSIYYNLGNMYFVVADVPNYRLRYLSYPISITMGITYRLTFTYNPNIPDFRVYDNGIDVTSSATKTYESGYARMIANTTPVSIGKFPVANVNSLNGTIDYCTIYNRVLIQDEIVNGICNILPITDADGNIYTEVTIGSQTWLLENLKTTHYMNGDPIQNITDQTTWNNISTGAYSDYNNSSPNGNIYGRLYNWSTVSDSRRIAPVGYHIPTAAEWNTLSTYLGGDTVSGGHLKEAGTNHWFSPNTGADNSSRFTSLPGGIRSSVYSVFTQLGLVAYYWTLTNSGANPSYAVMAYNYAEFGVNADLNKHNGISIRCIKD